MCIVASHPLFARNLEILNLAMPFLWLIFVLGSSFFFPGFHRELSGTHWDFVRNIIFLNTVHVLFSFILINRCSEVRTWIIGRQRKEGRRFWTRLLLIQFFFILLFAGIKISPELMTFLESNTVILLLASFTVFGLKIHHNLSQMRGIAKLYDIEPRLESAERWTKVKRAQSFEQILLKMILVVAFFMSSVVYFQAGRDRLPISVDSWMSIQRIFIVALCLGIYINFFRYPRPWNLNKFLYLARLWIIPLLYLSPSAVLALSSCHGVEYLCIFKTMKSRSENGTQWFSWYVLLILSIGLLLLILPYRDMSILSYLTSGLGIARIGPIGLGMLLGVGVSLSYTHYFLDAILFRFSQEETRELILPLIVGKRNI